MVRMVGLEPTRIAPADFESAASTISPHPRRGATRPPEKQPFGYTATAPRASPPAVIAAIGLLIARDRAPYAFARAETFPAARGFARLGAGLAGDGLPSRGAR